MGIGSLIGGVAGALTGAPGGTAVGATLGGLFDGGNDKPTAAEEYYAYQFQREKEWEATYGPIEDNMVNYYTHLSAAKYIAKGNQHIEEQFKIAQDKLNADLTARGLDIKGGVSTSILRDNLNAVAQAKAENYAKAEKWVVDQQTNFYNSMKAGKPNAQASSIGATNAEANRRAYSDRSLSAGVAASVDIADSISKGLTLGGGDSNPTDYTVDNSLAEQYGIIK
jgi:hypothetical protein